MVLTKLCWKLSYDTQVDRICASDSIIIDV